ncbi:hypothetical protein SAMN04488498_12919 [Mesorhizobium albiziae]|uniref:Uncharacterized protein n=1 Tax=Neomesorhizobium albiziae TaxID=335020 RepID=A0A1I4ESV4_9HYPH|nr:hypothetical protein GCM10007937_24580 [Mesorhizobium albiziae]SFL07627.1 hypothetical protein SAMN04488498_12919 [Mesorhizobium albiziae]
MSSDNIIPFNSPIRAQIKCEMAGARQRFGHDNIDLLIIVSSWGDTMDDRQVLDALRKLNRTALVFDDITDRAD